ICKLIKEYNIKEVIVGYPVNMNGTFGPRTIKTDEFIEHLTKKTKNVEIIKWDERLSTVAANRILNAVGIKSSKRKKTVDRVAATYILQGYLDSIKK
ncbi:MAG TPA: Holliday junction resolvase RuvX, partial [Clostridiaceae bacterium]|nr:Holliday junction resolvase RuvX [Clostridiaceae bacterium]